MRRWLELLAYATPALLALAAAPILARALGPADRGVFAIALVAFAFGQNLGNFGQAEQFAADLRNAERLRVLSKGLVTASASILAAVSAYLVLRLLEVEFCTALAVAVSIPTASFGLMLRTYAISRGDTFLLGVFEAALPAFIRLGLIILLFVAGALTVCAATVVTMFTVFLGYSLVFFILVRNKYLNFSPEPNWTRDKKTFLADLRYNLAGGLPAFGFKLNFLVMLRADIFILGAMSSPDQLGYYAAVSAVTDTAFAVSGAFKNRIQAAAYGKEGFKRIVRELSVLTGLLLPVVFLGVVFAEKFVRLLFGDEFSPAVPALQVLVVASVALILTDCGQGLLAVLGQRRAMFTSSLGATAIAILTSLLMVPTWGALGAAVSSLIAYSALALFSWIIAFRVIRYEQSGK